jgi:regulator of sirC expression with transglutaminase-like and TPR domain
MINESELKSMLYLLDDSDERVVDQISDKIISYGIEVIPFLGDYWQQDTDATRQSIVLSLISEIKQDVLVKELRNWTQIGQEDLLGGMFILNKILDAKVDRQLMENQIDKIKLDAWLELNYDLTSFEKVKILNHILFDVHGFEGDTENYHSSDNSFLSKVLENKKGNPVSLAIIYSIVAQKLNIPIYGVNLPQHFILGYVQDLDWPPLLRFNDASEAGNDEGEEIFFYINPFNKGLVFNRENINKFLRQLKLEPKSDYFKTCGNKDILLRVLRNLELSFSKEKKQSKLNLVKKLLKVLLEED